MVAAAQQGERTPVGFINPLLYSLTGTSAVRDVLPLMSATAAHYRGIYCAAKTCDGPGGNAGVTVRSFDSQDKDFTDQVTRQGLRHHDRHWHPRRPVLPHRAARSRQVRTHRVAARHEGTSAGRNSWC
jgi:hypothetical protein